MDSHNMKLVVTYTSLEKESMGLYKRMANLAKRDIELQIGGQQTLSIHAKHNLLILELRTN